MRALAADPGIRDGDSPPCVLQRLLKLEKKMLELCGWPRVHVRSQVPTTAMYVESCVFSKCVCAFCPYFRLWLWNAFPGDTVVLRCVSWILMCPSFYLNFAGFCSLNLVISFLKIAISFK